MPIYEYHCPYCHTAFERLVSYSKADEVACPNCGQQYAQRRISRIALRISGREGNVGTTEYDCADGSGSGGG